MWKVHLTTAFVLITKVIAHKYEEYLLPKNELSNIIKERMFKSPLFKAYEEFSTVIHIENSTQYSVSSLIALIHEDMYSETMVFNHDTLKYFNLRWRKNTPYLNIILLNNLNKYKKFLKSAMYLTGSDVVFFIIWEKEVMQQEFWHWSMLKLAGNVIVYNTNDTKISLYNVCYYCGNLSGKLNHLQTSENFTNINIPPWALQPHSLANFHKHHFNIAYINSFPNMFCLKTIITHNDTICLKSIGIEMEFLKILSKKLNFTYELREYGKSLNQLEKHLCVGTYNMDFMIGGVSITWSRASKVSFTTPVDIEPYRFLYIPRKARGSEFFDSIKPFKFEIWIIVFVSLIAFSIALYWSTKIHSVNEEYSLSTCFGICFKAVIEQVERIKLSSTNTQFSSHAILVVWWFACLIIATAYKSKLWAISIQNYNIEPSNLQQLMDSGYNIVVSIDNVEISEDILNNGDPLTAAAQKKVMYQKDICAVLEYILNTKGAALNEFGYLQYHALLTCSHVLAPNAYFKLRFASIPIHHTTHAWPLQRGAVYRNAFNPIIGNIQTSGLKVKWKSDCLRQISKNYTVRIPLSKTTTSYPDFDDKYFLKGFVSAFSIFVLGNIIALLCFAIEIFLHKKNK